MKVGVYGVGFVGGATADVLEKVHTIYRYDKFKRSYSGAEALDDLVHHSDLVFFCLPTPMNANDSIDYSPMHDSFTDFVTALDRIGRKRKDLLGVIRSTAVSGTTDMFAEKYSLRLAFNPEFLRERTAREDMENTSRIVIGASCGEDAEILRKVYSERFPLAKYHLMGTKDAEMVKYMANGMLAAQIALANEFFDICMAAGINYDLVKETVLEDSRIGQNLAVPGPDGQRGFGGKCFPKDLNALRAWARDKGFNPWLLDAIWRKNLEVRGEHDWLGIPGATSGNKDFR
jgi:UDPglucose 6-dehydrogenase